LRRESLGMAAEVVEGGRADLPPAKKRLKRPNDQAHRPAHAEDKSTTVCRRSRCSHLLGIQGLDELFR